jgi:transcriptional regulator with XRE-family HTH domain
MRNTQHPLRKYRRDTGISLEDLAKETNVHKSSISRIERGKQSPSIALMRRLIEASKGALSPNDFFGGAA